MASVAAYSGGYRCRSRRAFEIEAWEVVGMSFSPSSISAVALERTSRGADDVDQLERIRQDVSELYVTRRDYVFRYLVANCRNRAEAEDLTHEVFLRLYKYYAAGEAVENPTHWLITTARNILIDHIRSSRHQAWRLGNIWKLVVNTKADDTPTAEHALLSQARTAEINRVLMTLQGHEKDCLSLRIRGMAFREIAEALKIPMWLVVERTNSAITKFRRRVKT
jgi:RNA polymerase sigma-70 factor (ECF subfamily)